MDSVEESYGEKQPGKVKTLLGIRSNRLIFIICLFIASFFWLLIKLSDVYTVNYSFGIKYNTPPSSLRLTKIVDSTLDLRLTARGFAILKLNLFNDMDILDINLSNYSIDKKDGSEYALYTQELVNTLSELVNVDEKDIKLSRTVLIFEMEKAGEKLLPVIPDYDIKFTEPFDLYRDVIVSPEKIKVYGPQKILDSLFFIVTDKLILENVISSQVKKVELDNPYPDLLTFEDREILLTFEVEKFTESELVVPVNLSSIGYEIKTFPSQVTVYYKVAQKDYNEVRPHQFNIIPIADDLSITHAKKLPLRIDKEPDFVRNLRMDPREVEFLIIK